MTMHPATRDDAHWLPAPADTLCLDFVNTRTWRGGDTPEESLRTPDDLLSWLVRVGLPGGDAVEVRWQAMRDAAEPMLLAALALREAIYRVFTHDPVPEPDVITLNAALLQAPGRHTLVRIGDGFGWLAEPWSPTLPCLLAPVLWSAADLLAGPHRAVVRRCANPGCQWLFIDESKTGNRRWCSMASCGNREKARRHYQRAKETRMMG
jgi:predicted RNA-binding Zn ribbon-like protein